MAPKKKTDSVVADTRSALDIEIAQLNEQMKHYEAQAQLCKDGIADLAIYVAKIRTLELEISPKETDHKNVLNSFQRLCETVSQLKKIYLQADEVSPSSNSGRGASAPSGRKDTNANAMINPAGPMELQGSAAGSGGNEAASREAMKYLTSTTKNAIFSILQSVFDIPQTAAEKKAISDTEAAAHAEAPLLPTTPPAKATRPPVGAAAVDASKPVEKPVDIDLTCPIGIDSTVFHEALRMRNHRLSLEKTIAVVQVQLDEARAIVNRRRDEGASKLLLKKWEKQQEDAKKRMVELMRLKQEEEIFLRSQASNVTVQRDKGSAGKSRK